MVFSGGMDLLDRPVARLRAGGEELVDVVARVQQVSEVSTMPPSASGADLDHGGADLGQRSAPLRSGR